MILVANWKMNLDFKHSLKLADSYLALDIPAALKIYVLASDLVLQDLAIKFKGSDILVLAQDCSRFEDRGNFTGEISALQLKKIGVRGVLLGHMERRVLLGESNSDIALKLRAAINANLSVILSIGDSIPGQSFKGDIEEMDEQLRYILRSITKEELKNVTIAYESVNSLSAIRSNSDKEDDLDQIVMKLDFIQDWILKHFNTKIPILYGGALELDDLRPLYETGLVKGFLIGRNSLQIKDFKPLIKALSYL